MTGTPLEPCTPTYRGNTVRGQANHLGTVKETRIGQPRSEGTIVLNHDGSTFNDQGIHHPVGPSGRFTVIRE